MIKRLEEEVVAVHTPGKTFAEDGARVCVWVELYRSGLYVLGEHELALPPRAMLRVAQSIREQVPQPVFRSVDDLFGLGDFKLAGQVHDARLRHDGERQCVDVLVDPAVLDTNHSISFSYQGRDCKDCGRPGGGMDDPHHVVGIFLTPHSPLGTEAPQGDGPATRGRAG